MEKFTLPEHGSRRKAKDGALDVRNHQKLGDPAELGAAVLTLIEAEEPPPRFAAGSDSLGRLFDKTDQLRTEGETWRNLSTSRDGSF